MYNKKQTLMSCTNQFWKLWVGIAGMVVVNLVMIAKLLSSVPFTDLYLECIFLLFFISIPCMFIQCPKCGSRWFWNRVNNLSSSNGLFRQVECPECGASCKDYS